MVGGAARSENRCSVEALDAFTQHGSITFPTHPPGDVDHAAGIDPKKIAVVREVMDRTESKSVHDCSDALWRGVGNNVCRLNEVALTQRADCAAMGIRPQNVLSEPVLMQPDPYFPERVLTGVGGGNRPPGLCVGQSDTHLEDDHPLPRVILRHEHWRDDHVLTRGYPDEVDERALGKVRGAQSAIVRLVDGARSVVVNDGTIGLEDIVVGAGLTGNWRRWQA